MIFTKPMGFRQGPREAPSIMSEEQWAQLGAIGARYDPTSIFDYSTKDTWEHKRHLSTWIVPGERKRHYSETLRPSSRHTDILKKAQKGKRIYGCFVVTFLFW